MRVAIARASWSRVIFSSATSISPRKPAPVRFWRSRTSASSCSVSRPMRTSTWPSGSAGGSLGADPRSAGGPVTTGARAGGRAGAGGAAGRATGGPPATGGGV